VGPNIKPNSAATKQYVDSIASGVKPVEHVNFATTSEISSFPPTSVIAIDGVSPLPGDRILIKNQSQKKENGIWIVDPSSAGNAWQRAPDFPIGADVHGVLVFVDNGVQNKNTSWIVTGVANGLGEVIVQTDPIQFTKFAAAGNLIVGAGLYQSGQTLNVGASSSTQIVTTQCLNALLAGPVTAVSLTLTKDISQNLVFAGPSGSSGAPSFRKLEISDMPSGHTSSQWDSSGSNIYFTGGNVGIGTTNPSEILEVDGTIRCNALSATKLQLRTSVNLDKTNLNTYSGGGRQYSSTGFPSFSGQNKGRVYIQQGFILEPNDPTGLGQTGSEYCAEITFQSGSNSNNIVLLTKGSENGNSGFDPRQFPSDRAWPKQVEVLRVGSDIPNGFYIMIRNNSSAAIQFSNIFDCYIDWLVLC